MFIDVVHSFYLSFKFVDTIADLQQQNLIANNLKVLYFEINARIMRIKRLIGAQISIVKKEKKKL